MRIDLGRVWDRRTASVIPGVTSVVDSRDHEERKRNASTAVVGESPTCVRLQRNIRRHSVWKERQQRFLAYLADGTSNKTTSAANTKLATSKKTKC